jgi:hypothetical protein
MIFAVLVLGLPIVISFRLFQTEPSVRPFLATYALAVLGSSLLFTIAAFVLMVIGVGGLGPFDGIFEFIVSVPVALIIGLVVRGRRKRAAL